MSVCDLGEFRAEDGICTPCVNGTHKNITGDQACLPCENGTITLQEGSTRCGRIFWFSNLQCSGGYKEGARDAPLWAQFFFICVPFSLKIWPNNRLMPSLLECSICHCSVCCSFPQINPSESHQNTKAVWISKVLAIWQQIHPQWYL